MKYLFVLLLLTTISAAAEESSALKMTLRLHDSPDRIVELTTGPVEKISDPDFQRWHLDPKEFSSTIKEWLKLPGSVDNLKNCPRNYIRFELKAKKMKRIEFVCYDKSTSTRRSYIDFSSKYF